MQLSIYGLTLVRIKFAYHRKIDPQIRSGNPYFTFAPPHATLMVNETQKADHMTPIKSIACIGEAMIELAITPEGSTVGVAGDTLNTAVYLHRLAPTLTVDYVTRVGDDPFSTQITEFISDAGVGTKTIEVSPGGTPGLYAITTAADGERSFTYWRSAAAARGMFQTDGGTDFGVLDRYDALYLSGISLAILPQPVRLALINYLRDTSATVIYDSNYRPNLWEDADTARAITTALWERADIALPSIDDEMALFNEQADDVAARFLARRGQGALKRGPEGPLSLGSDVSQPYAPAAKVVDTTAAGDSFNGAYFSARMVGLGPVEAAKAAHQMAARVITHRGALMPMDLIRQETAA